MISSVACCSGAGVNEDSVTGSAHAVLTRSGPRGSGATGSRAPGFGAAATTCRLDGDQAWLGGHCVTVVEGTFYLPG
jgi:predicted PhzF superfamily epimerase YddE/YHI9